MAEKIAMWIRTSNGAFVAGSKDRGVWKVEGPFLKGSEINHAVHPTRTRWMPGAGRMCLHSIQCLGRGEMVAPNPPPTYSVSVGPS